MSSRGNRGIVETLVFETGVKKAIFVLYSPNGWDLMGIQKLFEDMFYNFWRESQIQGQNGQNSDGDNITYNGNTIKTSF